MSDECAAPEGLSYAEQQDLDRRGAITGGEVEQVLSFAISLGHESTLAGDARANLFHVALPTKKNPAARVTIILPEDIARALKVSAEEAEWDVLFLAVPRAVTVEMRRRRDAVIVLPGEA